MQCDRNDPGNWTGGGVGKGKHGCTKYGVAPNSTGKDNSKISLAEAGRYFDNNYAKPLHLDQLKSQGLLTEFLDKAVNCGEGTSGVFINNTIDNVQKIVKGSKPLFIKDRTVVTKEAIDWINDFTKTDYYSNETETNLTKEECSKSKEQGLIEIKTFDNGEIKTTREYCIEDKSNRVLFWLMYRNEAGKRYIKLVQKNPRLKPYFLSWMVRTIN